tara:strand:- start:9892 stop:10356 length:465 start_codon:yes stop_codon:yes gene_type:complete
METISISPRKNWVFTNGAIVHSGVTVQGVRGPTAEHVYQALKYSHDPEHQQKILTASSPIVAKRLGSRRGGKPLTRSKINKWKKSRIGVMRQCIYAKFEDVSMRKALRQTKSKILIHDAFWDSFWSNGMNNEGQNMLGKILMEVRQEIDIFADE